MCVLNQLGNLGSSALIYLGSLDIWLLERKTSMLKNLVAGGMQFLKHSLQPSAIMQANNMVGFSVQWWLHGVFFLSLK